VTDERRLYGQSGDECLYWEINDWYESQIEPYLTKDDNGVWEFWDRPRPEGILVEVHDVYPPSEHLPDGESILEYIHEWSCDNGMVDEGWCEQMGNVIKSADTKAAMEVLLYTIGRQMNYGMAKDVVDRVKLTWDEDGKPLVDGEPMYFRRADAEVDSNPTLA
jgi:hypothetical protein